MFFDIWTSLFIFFLCSGFIICLFTLNPAFLIVWLVILRVLMRGAFLLILNSWISYAVILLFTGGIIVLFRYIVSLIVSSKIRFFYSTKITLIFWLILPIYQALEINSRNLSITNLFLKSRNFLLAILVVYLLLLLLRIVYITRSNSGPIKSFFMYEQ